jgi:DNA-binding beta-propeller fold protein YncE
MSGEQRDDERLREILGTRSRSVAVPPFDALPRSTARSPRRSIAVTLAAVAVAVAALYGGRELSTFRQQQASPTMGVAAPSATPSPKVTLPQPIPQPITRTSAAAQVAWVSTSELNAAQTDRITMLVGVDPTGTIVGRIDGTLDPFVSRAFRSADGTALITVGDTAIRAYSALDGSLQRTFGREPRDAVLDVVFSPDGRWLALIGASAYVQVLDLRTGLTQTTPLGHDPNPQAPGVTRAPGNTGLMWSTLVFSPDSKRLYAIVDWAGPLSVTAFDVTPTGLGQTARAVDGQNGKAFHGCGGPGLAPKVVGGGRTLVLYCHVDGSVTFIDLPTLTTNANVQAEMRNPFWLAPIFTPDGQLLYLHQYPSFGDVMQVVDLRSHALLGPVPTPTKVDQPGPFSWLFPVANAGGTPSTVPVSPDGLRLYSVGSVGITVLRVPDLKPIATLAPGLALSEAWVSGDGKTIYATDRGKGLYVMPDGGGPMITVTMPIQIGGFFASEHG